MNGSDKTTSVFTQAVAYHFIMKRRVSRQDWDIARGYFGDCLAEKISGFGPATAESEGHIVSFDS